MAIESAAIAKIIGSITVVGSAGTAGYVYKDNISSWVKEIGKKSEVALSKETISSQLEKTYIFFVINKTGIVSNAEKDLYESTDAKTKNYECKWNNEKYDCEIVKKIEITGNKKQIETKEFFDTNTTTDKNLTKNNFSTENELFLLKIDATEKSDINWDNSQVFEILQKGTDKKFGELKPIFGKKNTNLLGKANLFLGKVKDFGDDTTNSFQAEDKKTYSCSFDNTKTENSKDCSIFKFTAEQQTDVSDEKKYVDLIFSGNETQLTSSDTLNKNEYYLIKFNNSDVSSSDYAGKDLIYLETTDTTPKAVVNFSSILSVFLFNKTSSEKNILIVNQ